MTVYRSHTYAVGGLYTHGGDIETHHDDAPPAEITRVWEIEPVPADDTRPWVRGDDGYWTVDGEGSDGLALPWDELLEDFGPVSDDENDAAIGLDELRARESVVHLLYPISEVPL